MKLDISKALKNIKKYNGSYGTVRYKLFMGDIIQHQTGILEFYEEKDNDYFSISVHYLRQYANENQMRSTWVRKENFISLDIIKLDRNVF